MDALNDLKQFYDELKSYKGLLKHLAESKTILGHEIRERDQMREKLVRKTGMLKQIIIEVTDKQYYEQFTKKYDMWNEAFNPSDYLPSNLTALAFCITATNEAIGKLESDIRLSIKDKRGDVIGEPSKDTAESAIHLFDKMQFHPRVIEASRGLFKDGYYSDAIFRAFTAVNNFVKEKSGLSPSERRGMKDRQLMAKVFDENTPLIKLNELVTDSDRNEQEGFKFIFMGATVGIRNPKAHDDIIQTDPYRTLEYLGLASLLMKRVEEGKSMKTGLGRTKWDWKRFSTDIKNRCESKLADLAVKLYEFTQSNADSISWGTGLQDGSFTFRKLGFGEMSSIFTMYSYGWIYINFAVMKDKNVPNSIMESFRMNLNKIPGVHLPKEAVTIGKYPRINEKSLTNPENIEVFQEAVISLCQQFESSKE